MKSKLVKEYLLPVRVVAASRNVKGAKNLLKNKEEQLYFRMPRGLTCQGKGYVILDFGRELSGGVRLLVPLCDLGAPAARIRLRFGESVGECCAELGERGACLDHSARELTVSLSMLADQEFGQTGFRFVRIDFLEEAICYQLACVYAAFTHRDIAPIGSFTCSDPLINQIYDTAAYTLFLNMQGSLWDGVKRDRLVWMGDLYPEILAATDLYGKNECVESSLAASVKKTPLPEWFSGLPSYSIWFLKILADYYKRTKSTAFVKKHLTYAEGILAMLDPCVSDTGEILFLPYDEVFFDWPTRGTPDARAGNRYLAILALDALRSLYTDLGKEVPSLCESLLARLKAKKEKEVCAKQTVAFGYLAGELDRESTATALTAGGAAGLSTFMSYFILRAISETADMQSALCILKDYYGGMLSHGATTFWEDFDIEWLKGSGRIDEPTPKGLLDLHGDFGRFCYTGFRHSLCHGWSAGPVSFLTEKVLGVRVEEAGCTRLTVQPSLGELSFCKGDFPTPHGTVHISHRREGDRIITEIDAPKGVQVTVL